MSTLAHRGNLVQCSADLSVLKCAPICRVNFLDVSFRKCQTVNICQIDESVQIVVRTSLQIPLCLAKKPTKNGSPQIVQQSVQFVLGRLVFIIHIYKFVTLQGSVRDSAHSHICTFTCCTVTQWSCCKQSRS